MAKYNLLIKKTRSFLAPRIILLRLEIASHARKLETSTLPYCWYYVLVLSGLRFPSIILVSGSEDMLRSPPALGRFLFDV